MSTEISNEEIAELERLLHQEKVEAGREDLLNFTLSTYDKFVAERYHRQYYLILDLFAQGKIKNLIISMPPQHGKSEGSSRRLPAYIAGKRPDLKTALVSYAATKAQKFGREIMNILNEPIYKEIFPHVRYPEPGYRGQRANTNMERESVNSVGSMKFVGTEGALTGDPVDMLIMDDLYKDWAEGNSPVIQEKVWDWYLTVADTRLHNDSQQLIVFTRWSENDLIAKLDDKGFVVEWDGEDDLEDVLDSIKEGQFLKINFRAIKEGKPTKLDPRKEGEPLWAAKHSLAKLQRARAKDPDKFDCLYQGDPENKEGLLYSDFKTYRDLPQLKIIKAYVDTADTGEDYLCAVVYGIPLASTDPHLYILDVLYTQKPMEYTEPETIRLLDANNVNEAKIESNNGGRGFARVIEKGVRKTIIEWFHQSKNKEARIYSNNSSVTNRVVMPDDWHVRFPIFYKHVTKYKKVFKANAHDDAPDTLTGIVETEEENIKGHLTGDIDLGGLNWGS